MAIKFLNTVQVDTDVLYVDTTNSNVGIGTSSPSTYFTLDVNGSANFSSDIQVGRNATALSFDMNPGYDSGSYYLSLYKNQTNDGGILLKSKPTSGSAQNDWQIVNQGTTGDLEFYAYGLAGNAFILDRETGNLQLPEYGAGTLVSDASGNITVSSGGGAGGPYLPLSAGSTKPLTGNLYIENNGPKIFLKDTTDDDDQAIYFQNNAATIEYVISTQDFTGAGLGDGMFIGSVSNDELALVTNNSTALYISTSQNVGIGTDSPADRLDLYDADDNVGMYFHTATSGTGSGNGLRVGQNNSNAFVWNYEATPLSLATSGIERMRIDSSGNVGIGTTSPVAKLHTVGEIVGGTTGFTSGMIGFTGLGSYNSSAAVENIDALYLRKGGANGSSTSIALASASGDNYFVGSRIKFIRTGSNSRGHLAFETKGDFSTNTTVERMRIEDGGNVGIGTTSPLAFDTTATRLHVKNAGSSGSVSEVARFEGSSDGSGSGGTIRLGTSNDRGIYFEGGRTSTVPYGKIGTTEYDGTKTLAITLDNIGNSTFAGNVNIKDALLSNQENTNIDAATSPELVAQVSISYTAAFFDFVVKKGTNIRSGTVYACHDGTNVEFTETSTNDLGDTSDVVLSVDMSGSNMRLLATVASDDWSVKSLIRAI